MRQKVLSGAKMVEDRDENDVSEQTEEDTAVTPQDGETKSQTDDKDADREGEENPPDHAEELDSSDVEEIDVTGLEDKPPSTVRAAKAVPPPPENKKNNAAPPPSPPAQEEDAITPTAPPPLPAELEAKQGASQGIAKPTGNSVPFVKPGPDKGTPEVVFDMVKGAEAEKAADAEEIDLDSAEEITNKGLFAVNEGPGAFKTPKMRRRRKRPQEWWSEIFDDDYLSLLPKPAARDDRREVDFIEKSLNVKKGSLILDLACGNGRHAVGMARRGYRIVGVDLSLPMLARAGELAQETDQKINFIHGDMRELGFDKTFDAIYCVGTSLGYFDDSTNIKVLEGISRALKPGAPFLLEVSNRDHIVEKQPNLIWFEGDGSVCMEETSFNYINSRLQVKRQLIFGDSGRQVNHELSVRLYSLHELGLILSRAGFVVHQVAGHQATPGAFFGVDSTKIIILAVRPA